MYSLMTSYVKLTINTTPPMKMLVFLPILGVKSTLGWRCNCKSFSNWTTARYLWIYKCLTAHTCELNWITINAYFRLCLLSKRSKQFQILIANKWVLRVKSIICISLYVGCFSRQQDPRHVTRRNPCQVRSRHTRRCLWSPARGAQTRADRRLSYLWLDHSRRRRHSLLCRCITCR